MTSVFPGTNICAPRTACTIVHRSILLCVVSLYCQPAWADPDAPAGSITYIREVPVRHAFLPGEPGDVHYVKTDPSEHVFGALTGLAPISDAEAAGISAETYSARDQAVSSIPDSLNLALTGEAQASRTSIGSMNGGVGHTITGTMSMVGSALSGALGSLGSAAGGD